MQSTCHYSGDADEFRYYLPRLFELPVHERGWVDESTLLLELQSAEWRTGPDVEQRAVEDFVVTLWKALLAGDVERPTPRTPGSLLVHS